MRNHAIRLLALLLLFGTPTTTASADEKVPSSEADDPEAARLARKALRSKVVANIETIIRNLDLGSAETAKVRALLSESQWEQAEMAFRASRGEEIHAHAHEIVPATIPGMMQKFVPGYMRSEIMASRRAGRRGPPSRAEIAKIQKDARTKIQPVMRKAVMASLDEFKQTRVDELLRDEKTMTRVLADRIIKAEVLGKDGTTRFSEAVEKAGDPASLTSGADSVMNDRTKKMLKVLELEKIVKSAGL